MVVAGNGRDMVAVERHGAALKRGRGGRWRSGPLPRQAHGCERLAISTVTMPGVRGDFLPQSHRMLMIGVKAS